MYNSHGNKVITIIYHSHSNKVMTNIYDKLGLSWAKLSCQQGFGCTVINICCRLLIYLK